MATGVMRRPREIESTRIDRAKQVVLGHAPETIVDVMDVRSAMIHLLRQLPLSYPNPLPDSCAVGEVDGIDDRRLLIAGSEVYCVPTDWLLQRRYVNRDGIRLTVVSRTC